MKPLTAKQRWWVLGGVLILTLAASFWLEEEAPLSATVRTPDKPNQQQDPSLPRERLSVDKLQRAPRSVDAEPVDMFKTHSWYVPPPPKPAPPPPPAPPPLPFTYLGKLLDGDKIILFLSRQDRNYAVKVGDTLDGAYRVDKIESNRVILTYLPLDMQQTLVMGSAN